MYKKNQVAKGTVKNYGKQGDFVVKLKGTDKLLMAQKVDNSVKEQVLVGDEVKVKIEAVKDRMYFGKITEITNKKAKNKYNALLDLAELAQLPKEDMTIVTTNTKTVPSDMKKDAYLKLLKKFRGLKKKASKLEEQLEKVGEG